MDFVRLCGVSVGESVVHWGVPNSSKGGGNECRGGGEVVCGGGGKIMTVGGGKIELQNSNTVKL